MTGNDLSCFIVSVNSFLMSLLMVLISSFKSSPTQDDVDLVNCSPILSKKRQ